MQRDGRRDAPDGPLDCPRDVRMCVKLGGSRRRPSHLVAMLAALLAQGLGACGGDTSEVAIRVGSTPIGANVITHWQRILARRQGEQVGSRQLAVAYVIAARWLLGEGEREGIRLSSTDVEREMRHMWQSGLIGGEHEARETLRASGETLPDARFEAEAKLAAARLRELALQRVPPPHNRDVVRYYRLHKHDFFVPERRRLLMTNRKTSRLADQVIREAETKRDFASRSEAWNMTRPDAKRAQVRFRYPTLEGAIYSAPRNTLVGPVKQGVDYFVFEVKRTWPAHYRPLSQLRAAIEQRVEQARQRKALLRYSRSRLAWWKARTECHVGYVVQRCVERSDSASPADLSFLELPDR
jgi:hypothetical protein